MAIDRDNFAERYARVAALLGESRNLRVRARSVRQAAADIIAALINRERTDNRRRRLLENATEALKTAKAESAHIQVSSVKSQV